MYSDFLNDRCDIYHLQTGEVSVGYGISAATASHSYPDEPDLTDVPCHFNRHGIFEGLGESAPARMYYGATKVQFPKGTDVRVNDRIVDKVTGVQYTISIPYMVGRNHHIAAQVSRMTQESRL